MPKVYVRTQPKSGLKIRHRAGMGFSDTWKEVDIDDATRAALEEDAYLEVSETPTVLVEVAAAAQSGAIDPYPDSFNPVIIDQDPNNPVKSQAVDDGSTGENAADGTDTGTASPVANEAENATGSNAPAVDAADAVAEGTADTDVEKPAINSEKTEIEQRIDAIKAAIAKLDPNNAEYWLKDGRPSTAALESVGGLIVTAAERDSVWASLNKGAE